MSSTPDSNADLCMGATFCCRDCVDLGTPFQSSTSCVAIMPVVKSHVVQNIDTTSKSQPDTNVHAVLSSIVGKE